MLLSNINYHLPDLCNMRTAKKKIYRTYCLLEENKRRCKKKTHIRVKKIISKASEIDFIFTRVYDLSPPAKATFSSLSKFLLCELRTRYLRSKFGSDSKSTLVTSLRSKWRYNVPTICLISISWKYFIGLRSIFSTYFQRRWVVRVNETDFWFFHLTSDISGHSRSELSIRVQLVIRSTREVEIWFLPNRLSLGIIVRSPPLQIFFSPFT